MNPSEHYVTIFTVILLTCANDLAKGAKVLKGSIEGDKGTGMRLSASSLAQEAQRIIDHLEKLRYTKEQFAAHKQDSRLQRFCARFVAMEKRFGEEVVQRLIDKAYPTLLDKARFFAASLIPSVGGVAEEWTSGQIKLEAPNLVPALEEIAQHAEQLAAEIRDNSED